MIRGPLPRHLLLILAGAATIASLQIAATHTIFSAMFDEPIHVAAGHEWLAQGTYLIDVEHPPLARVAAALPLWLRGVEMPATRHWIRRGNALLHSGDYRVNLRLVRLGSLFFFVIAFAGVAALGWRTLSPAAGTAAALIFATLPPVLAHAGIAGTDMALTACFTAALLAVHLWIERPTVPRAIIVGVAIGFGLLAKFSFLIFFPLCALILTFNRWKTGNVLRSAAAALLCAGVMVWAGYRFSFGRIPFVFAGGSEMAEKALPHPIFAAPRWALDNLPLPAPLWFAGILDVIAHDRRGHPTYSFGELKDSGWWYYFPAVLFLKTPLPALALAVVGGILLARRRPELSLLPLGVLLPSMTSPINIGVRHILPIYPLLSILAGYAIVEMMRRRFARLLLVPLLGWQLVCVAGAHPDYLPWFNEAARLWREPVSADSNLDWGQDVLRLAAYCRERKIDRIGLALQTTADLDRIGLPAHYPLSGEPHPRGWIAVSEAAYWGIVDAKPTPYRRFDPYYAGRAGKSIRIYRVP